MADLALKIGDVGTDPAYYKDGDIIDAFNRRRIRCVHAEHLCHLDHAGFTRDGLRPDSALAKDFREAVCQYRFQRISKTEISRIDLATGRSQIFSNVPIRVDGWVQHINVAEHLWHRLRHPGHAVFGVPGKEYWYGGREDRSNVRLDRVWRAIERKSSRRESEAEFRRWPAGRLDLRHHLMIEVEEFSDEKLNELIRSIIIPNMDGSKRVVAKRDHTVDWRSLSISLSDRAKVVDHSVPFDHRGIRYRLSDIVSNRLVRLAA